MTTLLKSDRVSVGATVPLARFLYADAHSVYSLRRTVGDVGSPAVRLRRSSDNIERTFSAEEYATNAPLDWAGSGGSAVLVAWINAAGRSDLMSDASLPSPTVISGGAYVTANGARAVSFAGGSNGQTLLARFDLAQPFSIAFTGKVPDNAGAFSYALSARATGFVDSPQAGKLITLVPRSNTDGGIFAGDAVVGPGALSPGASMRWVAVFDGDNSFLRTPDGLYRGNPGALGLGLLLLGATVPDGFSATVINEIAIWSRALSEERAGDLLPSMLGA